VGEKVMELSVGDVLQIGDCTVTIIDIDGPDVSFRVDQAGDEDTPRQEAGARLPR
jgi:hypothetical protein